MRRHLVGPGFFGLVAALVVTACAPALQPPSEGQSAPAVAPMPQRTLVFAVRTEPPGVASKSLRQAGQTVGNSVRLFNAELDYADDRGNIHPFLAEAVPQLNTDSWKVSPDGRMETTYRLKPDLVWHDGTPLAAEDFAFAHRVYTAPELGVIAIARGAIAEVAAPDPRTVVIRWRQLYPEADALGTGFQALPHHVLEEPFLTGQMEAFAAHPFWRGEYVGLGPYRMERWEPGAFIEGSAFERYVLGRPKIERVRVLFMGDPNVVLASLLAGEVHSAVDISLGYEQGVLVEREWAPRIGGSVTYNPSQFREAEIQFRPEYLKTPELLDVRVRRALLHAIDREQLNATLLGGKGLISDALLSGREPYYPSIESKIQKYPYDLRRSEQLLLEAGLVKGSDGLFTRPNGERLNPDIWAITGGNNDAELQIMVDGFRRVGVEAIPRVQPAAWLSETRARTMFPGLSMSGVGGEAALIQLRSAPPEPANQFLGGGGRGGWANPEFDRVVDILATTLDKPERVRLIGEMTRIFSEELPKLPLYFTVRVSAHVAALRGPLPATAPNAGSDAWNVHLWEWQS